MPLFGPSKKDITEAVTQALLAFLPSVRDEITFKTINNLTIDEDIKLRGPVEVTSEETRPARSWRLFTPDMHGKLLEPRPVALWSNTGINIIADGVKFRSDSSGVVPISPRMITQNLASGDLILLYGNDS